MLVTALSISTALIISTACALSSGGRGNSRDAGGAVGRGAAFTASAAISCHQHPSQLQSAVIGAHQRPSPERESGGVDGTMALGSGSSGSESSYSNVRCAGHVRRGCSAGGQRSSAAIRGKRRRTPLRSSRRETRRPSGCPPPPRQRDLRSCRLRHQRSAVLVSGRQRCSAALSGPQRHSAALGGTQAGLTIVVGVEELGEQRAVESAAVARGRIEGRWREVAQPDAVAGGRRRLHVASTVRPLEHEHTACTSTHALAGLISSGGDLMGGFERVRGHRTIRGAPARLAGRLARSVGVNPPESAYRAERRRRALPCGAPVSSTKAHPASQIASRSELLSMLIAFEPLPQPASASSSAASYVCAGMAATSDGWSGGIV